jgi:hypothetical protein
MLPRFFLVRAGLGLAVALLAPLSGSAQSSPVPDKSAAGTLPEYDYSSIDKWAKAAPKEAEQSVPALAAYLARGAKNDREKARAIFTWMLENVIYDWDTVTRFGKDDARPDAVLRTKLAACLGHTALYDALARAMGLKSVIIGGRTRELDIDPAFAKATVKGTNGVYYPTHAWNAVQIDGKWSLVDVTHCNGRGKRNDKIETSWPSNDSLFLVPATDLIYQYFPDDPRWQLLAKPLSRKEHEAMPLLGIGAAHYGIEIVKPKGPILNIEDKAQIVLKAPVSEDVIVGATLIYNRQEVKGPYVMTQRQGENVEITASAPLAGTFTLRVAAARKVDGKTKQAEVVVDYRLVAKKGDQETGVLPLLADLFTERKCYLYGPLTGVLDTSKPTPFKVAVPGALKVFVTTGGMTKELEGKDGVYSGEVMLQPGDVFLAATFEPDKLRPLVGYKAK